MPRLKTLQRNLEPLPKRIKTYTSSDRRITGPRLQKIRFNMWRDNPYCTMCNRITAHPYGYEIDHIVSLQHGGADDDHNRQLLCVECHAAKTKEDNARSR